MSQFSSDKPQVFIPPAFEDFRGYLSVPYDRDVPFQVCQINQGYSREAFTLRGLHFQMGEYAQAKMVSGLKWTLVILWIVSACVFGICFAMQGATFPILGVLV